MRGTRDCHRRRHDHGRFIPAGAGNARCRSRRATRAPVHPRGCGERSILRDLSICIAGSSPRVRGTLPPLAPLRRRARFIPAGAGNARRAAVPCASPAVHPRGCGERQQRDLFVSQSSVHPRGCGERICDRAARSPSYGSSPRVRGTRRRRPGCLDAQRFIPRVRGTHLPPAPASLVTRFIPAGAGNAISAAGCASASAVHPRGCGERRYAFTAAALPTGSSPRVRGTPEMRDPQPRRQRFIPAGAGNARGALKRSGLASVHPRGCGERGAIVKNGATTVGSSPRVRGTHHASGRRPGPHRFIPAGAGNADRISRCRIQRSVHPRGCGERYSHAPPAIAGPVHPRGCGERAVGDGEVGPTTGSSPRVRGTLQFLGPRDVQPRFIPAGAGNAEVSTVAGSAVVVHPRGCGERYCCATVVMTVNGSSPRVRETRRPGSLRYGRERFIPAGAGNAIGRRYGCSRAAVHPRGCGERVFEIHPLLRALGSSPRVRGTRCHQPWPSPRLRFIPAGAGNAKPSSLKLLAQAVHPRGCGERALLGGIEQRTLGSSPRVRGTRARSPPGLVA